MNMPTLDHPLDNVMWKAMSTVQREFTRGDALARRFRPEFARFAGLRELSAASLGSLASDLATGEVVALTHAHDVDPGAAFDVVDRKALLQMEGVLDGPARAPGRFRVLGTADVAQMTALVQLTAPGPWFERTAELGRFLGFEADGRLMAMAGERLRVAGHTEISGVCCHPDWRGRGLAGDLMRGVSQAIVARGETPFLHVFADNAPAIALYEKLGMRRRCDLRLMIVRRNDNSARPQAYSALP